MKRLVLDVETTTHNKGAWSDERNHCVLVGTYDGTDVRIFDFEYGSMVLTRLREHLREYALLVGHNLKFDLHWLDNLDVDYSHMKVRCTANTEFILGRQLTPYPSLDDCASKRFNETKIDRIKQYWDEGIQTNDIPRNELCDYLEQDLRLTWKLDDHQQAEVKPHQRTLISLVNQDMLGLKEMERNGLRYDRQASLNHASKLEEKIAEIQSKLALHHECPCFNWASNDHLSALLYGGKISEFYYEQSEYQYKSGQRKGQYRLDKKVRDYMFPRIYEPLKGTELAKEGYWSTDEDTLLSLKGRNKEMLMGILEMKKLQKDVSTYLRGLPKRQDEGNYFDKNFIFGNFNQTQAQTGRLSSSKPNLQNLSDNSLTHFVSRY